MEGLNLTGRKGLVVGIANEHSLAWSAAQHFHNAGAELAITYFNDKAKPFVEPLVKQLFGASHFPGISQSPQKRIRTLARVQAILERLSYRSADR